MYELNNKASKYMKQNLTELKGEMDKFTTVVEDSNTPISLIEKTN